MAGIEGAEQFAEFADKVEDLNSEVGGVTNTATKETGERLVEEITDQLKRDRTAKGGTYNSSEGSSPYSPGGTNDSSTDNFHLTETNAWKNGGQPNGKVRTVSPRPAVNDRAKYMAFGTRDHGPDGNMPMYFKVNGLTIVLSDTPATNEDGETVPLAERFEGEPTEVSGVDSSMYFAKALGRIKAKGVLQKELNKAFAQALQDSL